MAKTLVINDITYYSYADLEDANIYNNAIYGSSWNSLDPVVQAQLLVESTRVVDSYKYIGEKVDPEQPLKFPRVMASGKVSDEQTLIDLCCEIANYIYKNGSSSSGGEGLLSGITKWQIGDVHIDLKDDATFDLGGIDDYILKALEDWMISSSMQIWL
jgi:hypothetical protein